MPIVFLASGEFAIPTLRSLLNHPEVRIAAVVTQPDRPGGRGQSPRPTPVRQFAVEHGLPVIPTADVNNPMVVQLLKDLNATLGLVIAFGQKLGTALLGAFPEGCINLHASLLPKYRGAAPIQWAVINGERRTGVTVFRINERMDAGPVLTTRWTTIKPAETADELHDRLASIGPDAVSATLHLFLATAPPQGVPQIDAEATKAPKLTKQHGEVDFSRSAVQVANHICGMWSWPAATTRFYSKLTGREEAVTFIRARVAETTAPVNETPGVLFQSLYVSTGRGALEILEIQPASGRRMRWVDFVNGRHVRMGDFFGLRPYPRTQS